MPASDLSSFGGCASPKMNPLEKNFKLRGDQIRQLIPNMGGCYATDRIVVDGLKVGYMFRELPDQAVLSGWTFMAGDESQEYADDPNNWAIYEVNTICNYDPSIILYLNEVYGTALGRVPGTDKFREEPFNSSE
jgi:hypothetical protein